MNHDRVSVRAHYRHSDPANTFERPSDTTVLQSANQYARESDVRDIGMPCDVSIYLYALQLHKK